MDPPVPDATEAFVKVLLEIRSHLDDGTTSFMLFLELAKRIPNIDPHHIPQLVINLAKLLKNLPKAFHQLNKLLYPHARVDFNVLQKPLTCFVLKTSSASQIIVLDAHPDRLRFNGLSVAELQAILLDSNLRGIQYNDLDAVTDTALQGCLAQLVQNLLDDSNTLKTCRKKALAYLRKPLGIPPSLFLHDLIQLDTFDYTGLSDLYTGVVGHQSVIIKKPRVRQDLRDCLKIAREIVLCRQLRHPNILPFIGASFDEQRRLCGLVTPYMQNGNVMKFLEDHPAVDRLTPTWQIMKGLEFLHNFDPPIAHRDIKGANILVNDALVCCLSDFGLSSIPEISQRSRERAVGTFSWMAPEVLSLPEDGDLNLFQADMYSLGITIFEVRDLLTFECEAHYQD
ncbi:Serine/threonine-protein kinase CTR1 [Leucoagaricus sp. SymC.cos]|nr:Serine/threonine-protein kinase CTR1 [Leucoagaricus sp. SymC.cos]